MSLLVLFVQMLFTLPFISALRHKSIQHSSKRYSCLYMSDSVWFKVKIKTNIKEAEGIKFLEVEVADEIIRNYKTPGQYVQIRTSMQSKPGFYAIANALGTSTFSFIVKETEYNSAITSAAVGSTFEMSVPMGKVHIIIIWVLKLIQIININ